MKRQSVGAQTMTDCIEEIDLKCNEKKIGHFERHTKGIGSKLLQKMGYKGKRIRKLEHGSVEPIHIESRLGLGYNDDKVKNGSNNLMFL